MAELRTETVFDALKQPLALVESDERRRGLETYIETARTPLERAVFDLMSELVGEVQAQIGDQYHIRLGYQPGGLTVDVDAKPEAAASSTGDDTQWSSTDGDVEKITIRIPAELKDLAQQAASQAGTSANTWFVKALARAVRNIDVQTAPPPASSSRARGSWSDDRKSGRGSRISGWVGGDE